MRNYICVVGGANLDINARPSVKLIDGDSAPGKIGFAYGGVGRNITENLCLLGADTVLITAYGGDAYSEKLTRYMSELGADMGESVCDHNATMSSYVCLNDQNGEVKHAVSDMDILNLITPATIEKSKKFQEAALVVADCNLRRDTIERILTCSQVPVIIDPVSTEKAKKLIGILHGAQAIKPNLVEAEALTGIQITDDNSLNRAVDMLLRDVKEVYITMGSKGVFYADRTKRGCVPSVAQYKISTTGAGDSFTAAMVYQHLHSQKDIKKIAEFGVRAALMTMSVEAAVNPKIAQIL